MLRPTSSRATASIPWTVASATAAIHTTPMQKLAPVSLLHLCIQCVLQRLLKTALFTMDHHISLQIPSPCHYHRWSECDDCFTFPPCHAHPWCYPDPWCYPHHPPPDIYAHTQSIIRIYNRTKTHHHALEVSRAFGYHHLPCGDSPAKTTHVFGLQNELCQTEKAG